MGYIKLIKHIIFITLILCLFTAFGEDMTLKKNLMINNQIKSRGISNSKVLKALEEVDRSIFVPAEYQNEAYEDYPLPIGFGQTISQPYIVALMTELSNPVETDIVLEIGTGSGYQAAVISRCVKEVYTIEIVAGLAKSAEALLSEKSFNNVYVKCGDGYKGWPEKAPFDKIIVTAAPVDIPKELIKQLKVGGLMVIPVGETYQDLMLIEKTADGINPKSIIPVRFVPMVRGKQD